MRRVPPAWFMLPAVFCLAYGGIADAELIFLKDGTVLEGKVKRGGSTLIDPGSGQAVWMPQGAFFIDDGVRRLYFSPSQVQDIDERATPPREELRTQRQIYYPPNIKYLPPIKEVVEVTDWDEKWDRQMKSRTYDRVCLTNQHMLLLNPFRARVQTLSGYRWAGSYLTSEFGPAKVRKLLATHPDIRFLPDKPEEDNLARRLRAVDFLMQAGWFEAARDELDELKRKLPGQLSKLEEAKGTVRRLEASRLLTEIKQAQSAGRYQWARAQLKAFPEDDAGDAVLGQVRALRVQDDALGEKVTTARRLLSGLAGAVPAADQGTFKSAAEAIARDVNLETVDRLGNFVTLAQQAEQQKQQGESPRYGTEELLSLAITGWMLGDGAAEARPEVAKRLWRGREFVLKYLAVPRPADRDQLRQAFESQDGMPGVDEIAALIATLPPVHPHEDLGHEVQRLKATLPDADEPAYGYYLQLPPEYSHSRPHPVLIVLHGSKDTARDMLLRWAPLAARHGYILVSPEWSNGFDGDYRFAAEDHRAVLDVLLDLRSRFQVDSDRVFLFGLGQGADMAFDIGFSHPDLFAGVLPMSGQPGPFARLYYWRNAQYLPFYVVTGDYCGENRKLVRDLFNEWIPRGYGSVWVEYQGRGIEWFSGELPHMFDWMSRKRRAKPLTELGKAPNAGRFGQEFQTMRGGDNRFYWLTTDDVDDRHRNEASTFSNRVIPALLHARIGEGNQISVFAKGVNQLSLWFARGMIDFDKPVSVLVNVSSRTQRKLQPTLETLLEDLYTRGDRQRLFLARLDIDRF